jgi:very-short-patch-repair endonuclease
MNKPMATGTPTERTKPHRRVEKCLDEMSISYMSEREFPPYTLDVYLPEWHLAIEIDGPYHNQKHDATRDRWLLEWHGIHTLRLNATKWKSTAKVKATILAFIEKNCEEVEERKELSRAR